MESKMEWGNHPIDERINESMTCPPGNHRGGENDQIPEARKESRNETNWLSKAPESLEIKHTVCNANALVPRFEGEEDNQYETRDLPEVPIPGTAAPDPLSIIKISNSSDCEHVAKLPLYTQKHSWRSMKHFSSVLALRRTPILLLIVNSTQISAIEDSLFIRMSFLDLRDVARLTLNGTVHLEPPSDALKLEGECCCY